MYIIIAQGSSSQTHLRYSRGADPKTSFLGINVCATRLNMNFCALDKLPTPPDSQSSFLFLHKMSRAPP